MKDKRQVPLKGDMARIIHAGPDFRDCVGRLVSVTSDPQLTAWRGESGALHEGIYNAIEPFVAENGAGINCCRTAWLLRIPPDSEMKTMFGETEKPLEKA
jgi:hypothetical protein